MPKIFPVGGSGRSSFRLPGTRDEDNVLLKQPLMALCPRTGKMIATGL